ncbi:TetR family transcriptional regulator [Tropicibacter sp. Alg240-R139]|uniref:TetR family transcriptional regulator n=1 Tax=Tropicibacter sp. Alg240-R139 TaxID=2305991 RepID=UPI0013DEF294|nr:TetR family transcriptional regulator [Tropicibacter sp. Alg240-R139]
MTNTETGSRPVGNKGKTAKNELIAAVSRLMCDKDSIDFTFSEVSREAGMNAALIKYYFGSKEGLLYAVLERDLSAGKDLFFNFLERPGLDPREKMRGHLIGLLNMYHEIPYLNRLTQALTRDATEERVIKISTELIAPLARAQEQILKEGYQSGLFRKVDPMSFYFTAVHAAEGFYANRFVLNAAFDQASISDRLHKMNSEQVADILMRGISKEAS